LLLKKELITLSLGDVAEGSKKKKSLMMMMSENQLSQSQVHTTAFLGAEDLAPKSQFR
jgi:hypothetical protein